MLHVCSNLSTGKCSGRCRLRTGAKRRGCYSHVTWWLPWKPYSAGEVAASLLSHIHCLVCSIGLLVSRQLLFLVLTFVSMITYNL